ncbi:hypothetical protein AARAC_007595, partial [Aspergillus arachidicola]
MVETGNEDVDESEDKNEGWGLMILLCDQQERGRRGVFMHSLMISTIRFPLDPELHCQSLLFPPAWLLFLRFPFFVRPPGTFWVAVLYHSVTIFDPRVISLSGW